MFSNVSSPRAVQSCLSPLVGWRAVFPAMRGFSWVSMLRSLFFLGRAGMESDGKSG